MKRFVEGVDRSQVTLFIAWTPHVRSLANVSARFGNSGTASSPSGLICEHGPACRGSDRAEAQAKRAGTALYWLILPRAASINAMAACRSSPVARTNPSSRLRSPLRAAICASISPP